MQKFLRFNGMALFMLAVGFMVTASCDKDDDKPKPAGIGFEGEGAAMYETDDAIQIRLVTEKEVAETVVLSYSVTGSATQHTLTTPGDYEFVSGAGGLISIAKGSSQAVFEIKSREDGVPEITENGLPYDSLVITLNSVTAGPGAISEANQFVLYIFEDDLLVSLDWDVSGAANMPPFSQRNRGDVDMDLYLWVDDPEDDPDEGLFIFTASDSEGSDPEGVFLPPLLPDTEYSVSCIYFDGSANDVSFELSYLNLGAILFDEQAEFEFVGKYTLDHRLPDDLEEEAEIPINQTFSKDGLTYSNFSTLTTPTFAGRRSSSVLLVPKDIDQTELNERLRRIRSIYQDKVVRQNYRSFSDRGDFKVRKR